MPDVPDGERNPDELTALVAGQYVELHRRTTEARERITYLNGADAPVRADLGRRTLSGPSTAALRAAGVSLTDLNAALQRGIRAGRWSLGRGSDGTCPPEIDRAFGETAADWRRALAAANASYEESVRHARTALDGYAPHAARMRPGEGSGLAPFVFPQDTYVGDRLASDPAHASRERAFPRWLMRREVLPHRAWAGLPWTDLGDTNLVFLPDGPGLSYAEAVAAARGVVADQMAKSAPNRLRITWIDALHNGRSAGAFLRLAESGSLVVDGQVWTDPGGVESALLRVVDRMAVIERTCLLGEFAHLDAYNARPGVAPEAHQVVVVTGYPVGFRESSAALLRQITRSGNPAGISVIVVMDTSMAPLLGTVDAIAPSYARLTDGPGPADLPPWWSPAVLPLGEVVLGHAGRPYARVITAPQGEDVWVPCELRFPDEAVQASIIDGYARASGRLAASGLSPRELDVKRADPAARTVSLRGAMLDWLHEREAADRPPSGWDDFVRSDALLRTGISHAFAEIAKQAAYLRDQGYISAGPDSSDTSGSSGSLDTSDPTGLSFPRLTPKGGDAVMSGSTGAADFAANSGRSAGPTRHYNAPVFEGDLRGVQIAWGNHDVTQSQQTVRRAATGFEELAEEVTRTRARLSRFGLSAEDVEDASESADEILAEVRSGAPDRGRVRRSLAALRGFLEPVAGADEDSRALARDALDRLRNVAF